MPPRVTHAVLGLAAAVLVGACARPAVAPSPSSMTEAATDGRGVFLRRCASCHGSEGDGDGPVASSLRTPPPDLTRLGVGAAFPRERVIAVVTGTAPPAAHGSREMPVWSLQFGPPSGATAAASLWATRQLALLIDHLQAIQVPPSGAGSSAGTR
jgi:mono/diheme cytochrome c family protein